MARRDLDHSTTVNINGHKQRAKIQCTLLWDRVLFQIQVACVLVTSLCWGPGDPFVEIWFIQCTSVSCRCQTTSGSVPKSCNDWLQIRNQSSNAAYLAPWQRKVVRTRWPCLCRTAGLWRAWQLSDKPQSLHDNNLFDQTDRPCAECFHYSGIQLAIRLLSFDLKKTVNAYSYWFCQWIDKFSFTSTCSIDVAK